MTSVVRISKLLTDRNVEFIEQPCKLKCPHCKSILYNPCRLSCNCKYCRQCIDDLVASGKQFCPGNYENCESANLSQFLFDCKTSSKLLKLKVKCPEQLCSQECQLIELEDHLKRCTKKSTNCPFSDMGCVMENMAEEKLKVHFEAEICNHNRMLIEMIDNLKNEISCLKKELVLKDDHIELVSAGVQQARQAHDSMLNEINSLKAAFQSLSSDNVATKADIESIKGGVDKDLVQHLNELVVNTETKWQQAIQNRDEKDEEISKTIVEMRNSLADYGARIEAVNDCLNKKGNADFVWIADFGAKPDLESGGFSGAPTPYKFRLALQNHVNGCLLTVQLQILIDESNELLIWPFRGNVTINIMDKSRPKICKSASRHCQIAMPVKGNPSSSEKFIFDYSDWNKVGIVIGNDMVVSCSVVED